MFFFIKWYLYQQIFSPPFPPDFFLPAVPHCAFKHTLMKPELLWNLTFAVFKIFPSFSFLSNITILYVRFCTKVLGEFNALTIQWIWAIKITNELMSGWKCWGSSLCSYTLLVVTCAKVSVLFKILLKNKILYIFH